MVHLDENDRAIISALLRDGRASQRTLAKEIGVSQGTITNRLARLTEMGVIRGYTVEIEPEKVGWTMTVLAHLRIQKGMMIKVQKSIADDDRVVAVYDVTGDYDSMVIARCRNRADLNDLTKNILSTEGITRSVTQVVLNTVKESGNSLPNLADIEGFD